MAGSQSVSITNDIGTLTDDDMFMPTVVETKGLSYNSDHIKNELSVRYSIALYDDIYINSNYSDVEYTYIDSTVSKHTGEVVAMSRDFNVHLVVLDYNVNSDSFYNDLYIDSTVTTNFNYIVVEVILYSSYIDDVNTSDIVLTLSSSKMFCYPVSIHSSLSSIYGVECDIEAGKGRITALYCSIVSSSDSSISVTSDTTCSFQTISHALCEVETTYGFLSQMFIDSFSSKLKIDSYTSDIRLHSLELMNLSMSIGEFKYLGSSISIDVIDTLFDINTSESFFEVNGHIQQTVHTPIVNGVRMTCDLNSAFISPGKIKCTAHAHNVLGDYMYIDFYTLYGISAEYYGENKFDYNDTVTVLGCATNEVQCPHTQCGSFVFSTEDYPHRDISSSVSCVVHTDIQSEVVPLSTAFFYGREYTIKISGVKDNSGNIMEDTHIRFKIENP